MYINSARLSMMNDIFHRCWIGARLHLKASDTIIVNVILLEISLQMKRKNTKLKSDE